MNYKKCLCGPAQSYIEAVHPNLREKLWVQVHGKKLQCSARPNTQ